MGLQRFGDLLADGHDRIERIFRVLQHHGDAATAQGAALTSRHIKKIDAIELKFPGSDLRMERRESHDGATGLGFARAGFANNTETLAAKLEADTAHGLDCACARREGDAQVFNSEKRLH